MAHTCRPLLAMLALLCFSAFAHGEILSRPDKLVFQYAGNFGMISAGAGWETSKRTELHLLAGYAPESLEGIDIYVAGAKGNYQFAPLISNEQLTTRLYAGLAFLYYFGDRYTTNDYPRGYYNYPAQEWHFMPYLGWKLISNEAAQRGVAVYAEVGIIDAYLIHYYNNYETLELQEAINLSIGFTVPLR